VGYTHSNLPKCLSHKSSVGHTPMPCCQPLPTYIRHFRGRMTRETILILSVLACVGCSEANTSEEGAAASQWTVGSMPVTTIGELDGAPEYLFSRIVGVRLLPDGRVAVADCAFRPSGTASSEQVERSFRSKWHGIGAKRRWGGFTWRPSRDGPGRRVCFVS